jgi:hypothetical protein
MSDAQSDDTTGHSGVAQDLRESRMDIVVHQGNGRDVFLKADSSVLLLDKSEARILAKKLTETVEEMNDAE